ncbi:response regulator transcription factor [Salipaludibacillus agaradhaerens]|uniref:response regulator transcription factor n=1 Tax=Salipaludibacillus agaradhaerens TaxID=76935 RepID=UPI0021510AA5|nr:response regulator transcription factor [Salipaludibacillus agaradhaerens]MCR6105881.1 response regulator transcription factor [Salipaludibacillus agaradhaerens]MCR6117915.1 response regulator transcription factor [Salipaludibacillus agaradhaerens]
MGNHILYIEDDNEVGDLVKQNLIDNGYELTWLKSGNQFDRYLDKVEMVILDIMLPGLDGFTVGQRIKEMNETIPILFLTARTAIEDKLKGLEFADDYLTKPFHPKELLLRIDILLRRFEKVTLDVVYIDHLKVDLKANQIFNTEMNEEIFLTEKQFKIFHYLLRNTNQILTKEQIYSNVWNQPYIEGDKTLNVHIRYLRQKIEKKPEDPKIIQTIRGLGYRVKQ